MAQDQNLLEILPTLVAKGVFQEDGSISAIDVFDLDFFESRITALKAAFPEDFFNHSVAIKANPIRGIIQFAARNGLGAEAASICETIHALSLGLEANKVILGSPCKTKVINILCTDYSDVPNRRPGPNKRPGGKNLQKSISVLGFY